MSAVLPPLFDAVVRIDRLPSAGRDLVVLLDAPTRTTLAQELKISAVELFDAKLTIAPFRGGIRAQGRLLARIVQPSVVSFEAVTQEIDEVVDRIYLPEAGDKAPTPGSEVFVDLEDDDFPDHLDGPEVDLSALLVETLALAIDAYPRRPGESLESLGVDLGPAETSPFAALNKLKKSGDSEP
jgi:hypothetical protein